MGLIADLDCPHVIPVGVNVRRLTSSAGAKTSIDSSRRLPRGTIMRDTPLVPRAAAEAVWEEACLYLGEELPAQWIDLLTDKAEAIHEHSPHARRRMRGPGNTGRDWLWAFMRHWLAALLQAHRPALFRRLPARYAVGEAPSGTFSSAASSAARQRR